MATRDVDNAVSVTVQRERVPSQHLRAVTQVVKGLRTILDDPNTPSHITTTAKFALFRIDPYKTQLELQESIQGQTFTSSETQAIRLVKLMIDKIEHHKSIVITPEKKEALQQEIDALETLLKLAEET